MRREELCRTYFARAIASSGPVALDKRDRGPGGLSTHALTTERGVSPIQVAGLKQRRPAPAHAVANAWLRLVSTIHCVSTSTIL